MMQRIAMTSVSLLLGLAAASAAFGAGTPSRPSTTPSTKTTTTPKYYTEAAQSSMADIEMARLALERAQDPELREFAQRLIDDQTKAGDELRQLSTDMSWDYPAATTPSQQAALSRLRGLSGTEFDREFAREMAMGRNRDVRVFEGYSQDATSDARFKTWATNTLPTLRTHQEMARTNAERLGVGNTTGSMSGASSTGSNPPKK